MRNRKIMVIFMLILLLVPAFSIGFDASAAYAYDVDFSIKPDKTEVNAGDTFNVDIVITTRKSGYVEFDFELTYDESIVACELDSYNQDGYTGDGTAEGIFKLTYRDPSNSQTPTPTEKDSEYSVRVAFKAKDVTQKSNVVFKGKINKLSGVNTLDNNKVKALTPATLVDKNVYVLQATNVPESTGETGVSSEDGTVSDDTTVGYIESMTGNDTPQQIVEEKNNDTLKIALIIVGGLIVFGSGFVVGYMVNSKKNNSAVSVKHSGKNKFDNDYGDNDYSDIAGLNNRVYNSTSASEPENNFHPMSKSEFTATQPQSFNNTAVPASQNIYTAGNIFVRGNPNTPSTPNTSTSGSAYPAFGTPLQQAQTQQNRPAYSENTYATNVPKYGTNFEGTYARYANRQQQMQRTYSQPTQTTGYQMNRPMNNAGTYAPVNANQQVNQQPNQQQQTRTGFFSNPSAQQQQYYQNRGTAGRYPTQENTAYPTSAPTNVASQYSQNNNNQQNTGYKPSQPSPITGGYKPSNTSNNGFNNRPY